MNNSIIGQLIVKDWQLNRGSLFAYMLIAAVSLWLLVLENDLAFTIGSILLITVVAIIGIHMVFISIVKERSQHTLPFIMSLPVSYRDYTIAKILSNVIVAGGAWLALLLALLGLISSVDALPNGLIPYTVLIMLHMLTIYSILIAVALVSESETITVVVMGFLNVTISIFMMGTAKLEPIYAYMEGPIAVWNATSLTILSVELGISILAIALTFYFQSKKRSYL